MKKIVYPALIATIITTSAFTIATGNKWTVKEDAYSVKFSSKKGKDMSGVFKGLKSDIQFDEVNLSASKISASIDPSTVNTGNGMRNKHAKQGLGAEQFSSIKFESTAVTKVGSGYEAAGKLTIKDVTKDVKLPFTFTKNAEGGVFKGKFTVAPSEYHVDKKGTPELLEIELNIPVTK